MKMRITHCLSSIMAVFLLFVLCVPVYASSGSTYNQKVGLWDWLSDKNSILPDFVGYMAGTICPKSDDGYHHANSYQIDQQNGYYTCICSYCGRKFEAYESDLQQSYDQYVSDLPATTYDSSGQLRWRLNVSSYNENSNIPVDSFIGGSYFKVLCVNNGGSDYSLSFYVDEFIAPVSGDYHLGLFYSSSTSIEVGYYFISYGPAYFLSKESSLSRFTRSDVKNGVYYEFSNVTGFSAGSKVVNSSSFKFYVYGRTYQVLSGYIDVICEPAYLSGDTYSIQTRPTTITGGNYGIVGDNGQIIKVTNNNTIINETNNTYYNPATGNTETVNSWTYDYSDRSYNITLESGDTVTVTYGDENITIVEGDVNYTIYYIIDGSGSGSDDICEHEWYQTGHRQGNCLTAEQRTYTCSKCNKQYTETDPAPGHSWHIIQEVSTKYDESGVLIQEGYTVYECERCGEQYKATNDIGPPPSGGGGSGGDPGDIDDGGLLEWINGLIQYLSDHLSGAVELILSFFRTIPELFGGFLDFLSAMFPFLPDEIWLLLTFGIAAVVFVGIIKAIRR